MISVLLGRHDVHVAPGSSADLPIVLVNNGDEVLLPRIEIEGAPDGVVSKPRLETPLTPGESRSLSIGFTVPDTFSTGNHVLSLRLTAGGADPTDTLVEIALSVLPLDKVALSVSPASIRGRVRGRFEVVLQNRSNRPVELALRAEGDRLTARFKPSTIRVRPGERTTTRATVRARPVWFSTSSRRQFAVVAQGRSLPLRSVASFAQQPIIGPWLRRGTLVAGMVAMAIAGVVFSLAFLRGEVGGGDDEVVGGTDSGQDAGSGSTADAGDGAADESTTAGAGSAVASLAGAVTLEDGGDPLGVEIRIEPVSLDQPLDSQTVGSRASTARAQGKNFALVMQHVQASNPTYPITEIIEEAEIADGIGTWDADLAAGRHYEVRFTKEFYTTQSIIVSPTEDGEMIEYDVVLEPGTSSIGGRVTDGSNGLGGATITVTDGELTYTTTSSTEDGSVGEWRIDGIGAPARYVISIELPGRAGSIRSVTLDAGEDALDLEFPLVTGTGSLGGIVSSSGGAELGGVTLTLTGDDFELTTTSLSSDQDCQTVDEPIGRNCVGWFIFPEVPLGGPYTLASSAAGQLTQTEFVSVDGATRADVTMRSATGTISGNVTGNTDLQSSIALESVRVTVTGNDLEFTTTTADTGDFAFADVPPGEYTITYSRFEYATTTAPIEVFAGQDTRADEVMVYEPFEPTPAAASILGTVRNTNNDTVSEVLVTVLGHPEVLDDDNNPVYDTDDQGNITIETNLAGEYRFDGLNYGAYTVRFTHPRHQGQDQTAQLGEGTEAEVSPTLNRLGSFNGYIRPAWSSDSDVIGMPTQNGTVTTDDDLPVASIIIGTEFAQSQLAGGGNDDGYWAIQDSLVPGTYDIEVSADGFERASLTAEITGFNDAVEVGPVFMNLRPRLVVNVFSLQPDGSQAELDGATVELLTVPTVADGDEAYQGDRSLTADASSHTVTFEEPLFGSDADTPKPIAGDYTLQVSHPDHRSSLVISTTLTATAGTETASVTEIDVLLVPEPPADEVGGDLFYLFDSSETAVPGDVVVAGDIRTTTGAIDPTSGEPATDLISFSQTFSTSTWHVPEHRIGTTNYSFTQTDGQFATASQEVTVPNDPVYGTTLSDIDVELDPLGSTINGSLSIALGSTPIGSIDVTAEAAAIGGGTTLTAPITQVGASGTFQFTGLAPGTWVLSIDDAGGRLTSSTDTVIVYPATTNSASLGALVEQADLSVVVATDDTTVTLSDGGGVVSTTPTVAADTPSAGLTTYTFENLTPGTAYSIEIAAECHYPTTLSGIVLAAGVDQTAGGTVDLTEWGRATGTINGRIGLVHPMDTPLGGVDVSFTGTGDVCTALGEQSTTDASGNYSVRLEEGTYTIGFNATNYQGANPDPTPGSIVMLGAAGPPSDIVVDAALPVEPVDVEFRILSDQTGAELVGARVVLTDVAGHEAGGDLTQPAAPGTIVFSDLQPVTYRVEVSAADHSTVIITGLTVTHGIGLQEITLDQNVATVSGTVTATIDVGGGTYDIGPVGGVEIDFPGGPYTTATDGTYSIADVTDDRYVNVEFDPEPGVGSGSHVLYDRERVTIDVEDQVDETVDVQLEAIDTDLELTVTATDANPSLDLDDVDAQLILVQVAGSVERTVGSSEDVDSGGVDFDNIAPSLPHTLASGDRLFYWVVELSGTNFATTRTSAIDVRPSASASTASVAITSVADAPADVSATAAVGEVTVTWTAVPTTDDGGADVQYYRVFYGESGGTLSSFQDTVGATTSATITGLDPGTEYEFEVLAINAVNAASPTTGIRSSSDTATTPSAPATVATPMVTVSGTNELTVDWDAPTDTGGNAITGYQISYSPTGGSPSSPATVGPTTTELTVTGLTAGLDYTFEVRAQNSVGLGGAGTSAATTAVTVPGAPTGVAATSGNGLLSLSWTAPTATGGTAIETYRVTLTGGAAPITRTTSDDSTSLVVSGLVNGTTYTVTVASINSDFTSSESSSTTGTPYGPPTAPQGLGLTPTTDGFTLAWSAPSDDGGSGSLTLSYEYEIDDSGTWLAVTLDSPPALGATLTGLTPGVEYTIALRAVNSQSQTGPETSATATVAYGPPSAPRSLALTPTSEGFVVAWSAPSDDGGAGALTLTYEYEIDDSGTWLAVTLDSAPDLEFTIAGLDPSTEYTIALRAVNSEGITGAEATETETTDS